MRDETIRAYDLGEEGEQWMVEATLDTAAAEQAVHALWAEQNVEAEYGLQLLDGAAMSFEAREDWYWDPINELHADEDAYLRNVENHGNPESRDTFMGVLVVL